MALNILLVGGNVDSRLRIQRLLMAHGHAPTLVDDEESALALCRKQLFDLFLLDWDLPGMVSLELCRSLKVVLAGKSSIILFMTATLEPVEMARGLAAGAIDFLLTSLGEAELDLRLIVAERLSTIVSLPHVGEERLRASEERFRTAFESTGFCMGLIGLDGYFIRVNAALCRFTGYTEHELQGMTVQDVTHPDDRTRRVGVTDRLLAGEATSYMGELRYRRKDGATIWGMASVALLRDESGAPLHFVAQVQDVTPQKTAAEALRANEASLRQLLSKAPIGMCITSLDGIIEHANEMYSTFFGYDTAELTGSNIARLFPAEQQGAAVATYMARAAMREENEREWEVFTRTGERRTVLGTGTTIMGIDGQPKRVSFLVDITARKRVEEHFIQLAHYDRLTGLPNRTLWELRLTAAVRQAREKHQVFAVLFVDLDGFKAVNDTHGHSIGDLLLQVIGEQLMTCVRDTDMVARLAGDEFIVFLQDIRGAANGTTVARKMIGALNHPLVLAGRRVLVSASIGIAFYPCDGEDPALLVTRADAAMYAAKHLGKNRYALYSDLSPASDHACATSPSRS